MRRLSFQHSLLLVVLAVALLAAPLAEAATVLKMDLGELCARSNSIYRGRIVSAEAGTVSVGGTELPTMTYRVDVSDAIVGDELSFIQKGDQRIAEITMLAGGKTSNEGDLARFSKLPEMPNLEIGQEYLLMTTRPSAVGLSTTVGLGQGCFHIDDKTGMAVNELSNAGLSASINGPVAYSSIADEIRALIGQ